MDPDVPETLVPDVVGADELNVDNLTEDNYASGSESIYDATKHLFKLVVNYINEI